MSPFSLAALSGALLGLLIVTALCLSRGPRAYANRVLAVGVLLSTAYLLSVDVLLNLGQFEPFSYSIHMLSIDILVVLVYFASFQ